MAIHQPCEKRKRAFLALEDSTIFSGWSDSESGTYCGEVIFTTAMGGYQEVCTDPSYTSQIVVFTTPHIGNTGTNDEDAQSPQCSVAGIITRHMSAIDSNWRSTQSLPSFLRRYHIPALYSIDTRRLTRHIREQGSLGGCIAIGDLSHHDAIALAQQSEKPSVTVSTSIPYEWNADLNLSRQTSHTLPPVRLCVMDFGVKRSLLQRLTAEGCRITVVPPHLAVQEILAYAPDGIVLSNGPGDPQDASYALTTIRQLIERQIPLLGVCFGCQLLGLAAGGTTVKMQLGHHGINHPVIDLTTGQAYITSQNHNFVIADANLPSGIEVTHRSLVDHSIEGIRYRQKPAFGFQGHPEGGPGPSDIGDIFHQFVSLMRSHAKQPLL
jgi:carbamoyl-phosphate synthase small subunit